MSMFNMKGGELIDEGGYGCVFHPAINEKGEDLKTMTLVSKLQKYNTSAINEIEISAIISKIIGYINHFAPVIRYANINVSKIKTDSLKNCSIISDKKIKKLINLKMNYVDGGSFLSYLIKNKNNKKILNNMIHCYIHILKGIKLLLENNIIHYDIKGDNILFDEEKEIPIIIDFGLSINVNTLKSNTLSTGMLKKYFYVYAPDYYIWPLEVHYISYLINVNMLPSEEELKNIAREVTKNNKALRNFSPNFISKYEDLCYHQLLEYKKTKNLNDQVIDILNYYEYWDNYGLSVLYLKFLKYFKKEDNYVYNNFIVFFSKLLMKNIHPNPEKRVKLIDTWQIFTEFIYNNNIGNIKMFNKLTQLYIVNRDNMNKELLKEKENLKKITKKSIIKKD